MDMTPGVTPVNDPKAVAFCQNLALPIQRGAQLGNPDSWKDDPDVHSALVNLHGKASEAGERLKAVKGDLTVTVPVRHENAAKLATKLIEATNDTAALLERRAKEYQGSANDILQTRFKPDPAKDARYTKIASWIEAQAKNPDNGYTEIRKAIDEDPDFALTMYNTSWRLLGLPQEQVERFKDRIDEKYAPDALACIESGMKLSQLAKRYPAFSENVKSSFYSSFELAKVRTRYVP
ncbi:hypothetical protein [Sphingobium yanoikuyae]|jgi:hypothetical protein|uniref:hypothetical protein n=1 Tax=Sphingobium yanoikuyae TaxID=13690 RepID=UPI0028AFEB5B|nr:hypothetical protein [Sphingobium yanoikuyae]